MLAAEGAAPRIAREAVGHRDSHNELASLLLDITAAVDRTAGERAKAALIRRLRRGLLGDGGEGARRRRRA